MQRIIHVAITRLTKSHLCLPSAPPLRMSPALKTTLVDFKLFSSSVSPCLKPCKRSELGRIRIGPTTTTPARGDVDPSYHQREKDLRQKAEPSEKRRLACKAVNSDGAVWECLTGALLVLETLIIRDERNEAIDFQEITRHCGEEHKCGSRKLV
eukprot:Gb_25112 [translate_table: standard]